MLTHTWGVSLIAIVCLGSGLTLPNTAQAAAPDYSCYMQLGSKQVIDLTRSVCGFSADKAAKSAATDAAYLNAIKKLVGRDIRTLSLIDNSPGVMIAAAQSYCAARATGISDQQYMESKYKELQSNVSDPATMNSDSEEMKQYETTIMANGLAIELAPKVYCPSAARR